MKNYKVLFYYCEFSSRHLEECLCSDNPGDNGETMRLPRFARNDVVGNPHTHLSLRGTKCRGNLQQKIGKSRVTMSHTYSGQIE